MKQLTDNLNELFAEFAKDAASQVESGNKAAGTRVYVFKLKCTTST